jgi:hypothetical protein
LKSLIQKSTVYKWGLCSPHFIGVGMSKIGKVITIFIVFLTLVALLGLFTNPLSEIRTPANNELENNESIFTVSIDYIYNQ